MHLAHRRQRLLGRQIGRAGREAQAGGAGADGAGGDDDDAVALGKKGCGLKIVFFIFPSFLPHPSRKNHTLSPAAIRSRVVSQMRARLVRLMAWWSLLMRDDVPTFKTCGVEKGGGVHTVSPRYQGGRGRRERATAARKKMRPSRNFRPNSVLSVPVSARRRPAW